MRIGVCFSLRKARVCSSRPRLLHCNIGGFRTILLPLLYLSPFLNLSISLHFFPSLFILRHPISEILSVSLLQYVCDLFFKSGIFLPLDFGRMAWTKPKTKKFDSDRVSISFFHPHVSIIEGPSYFLFPLFSLSPASIDNLEIPPSGFTLVTFNPLHSFSLLPLLLSGDSLTYVR